MTLFEAINTKITGDATLSALTACYPISTPEDPIYPWAYVRRVSGGTALMSHDGDDGLNPVRIEITIVDSDVKRCEQLATNLRTSFKGGLSGVRFFVGGFAGPRSIYHEPTRSPALQLDILGLLDEATVT